MRHRMSLEAGARYNVPCRPELLAAPGLLILIRHGGSDVWATDAEHPQTSTEVPCTTSSLVKSCHVPQLLFGCLEGSQGGLLLLQMWLGYGFCSMAGWLLSRADWIYYRFRRWVVHLHQVLPVGAIKFTKGAGRGALRSLSPRRFPQMPQGVTESRRCRRSPTPLACRASSLHG